MRRRLFQDGGTISGARRREWAKRGRGISQLLIFASLFWGLGSPVCTLLGVREWGGSVSAWCLGGGECGTQESHSSSSLSPLSLLLSSFPFFAPLASLSCFGCSSGCGQLVLTVALPPSLPPSLSLSAFLSFLFPRFFPAGARPASPLFRHPAKQESLHPFSKEC